jgi:hypothetical protein
VEAKTTKTAAGPILGKLWLGRLNLHKREADPSAHARLRTNEARQKMATYDLLSQDLKELTLGDPAGTTSDPAGITTAQTGLKIVCKKNMLSRELSRPKFDSRPTA